MSNLWKHFCVLITFHQFWDASSLQSGSLCAAILTYSRQVMPVSYLTYFQVCFVCPATKCLPFFSLSKCPLFRSSRLLAPLAGERGHVSLCILWCDLELPEERSLLYQKKKHPWMWCNQTGMSLDPLLSCSIKFEYQKLCIVHTSLFGSTQDYLLIIALIRIIIVLHALNIYTNQTCNLFQVSFLM